MDSRRDGEFGYRTGNDHWKLLASLKTTVDGLVSANNPNVWSKYGGLERLCRDMNNILLHGLLPDQVYCTQRDFWPFVKHVRWVCPHLSCHIDQFLNLEGESCSSARTDQHKAQRWLQHSLQFHCLSVQLKPLLSSYNFSRKFYSDSAFLLDHAYVTAMFQCLEAVEQNDPKLLAQIDTSMFTSKSDPSLTKLKSQSLTALPGSRWVPPADGVHRRYTTCYSSLPRIPSAMSGPLDTRWESWLSNDSGVSQHDSLRQFQLSLWGERPGPDPPVSENPQLMVSCPSDALLSINEAHSSTPNSPSEDPLSDVDDGPEYLAIGNLGRRVRASSQGSIKSASSNSLSSQKAEGQATAGGSTRSSSLLNHPRRSSFSEGQNLMPQGCLKKSHARSHSDTGLDAAKLPESHADGSKLKDVGAFSSPSSELSTPSSLYMEAEGAHYLNAADGMFRRPSEGQSLISYLAEQDFGSCADLEKENAHFSISESLIAAIELMKCNLMIRRLQEEEEEEEESDKEIQELKQKIRIRRQQIRTSKLLPRYKDESDNFPTTDSGSQISSRDSTQLSDSGSTDGVDEYELRDADIRKSLTAGSSKHFLSSEPICSSFFHSNSAEAVAMGLLKQFEGMQLPAASELDWLVPEHDAPQKGSRLSFKKLCKLARRFKKKLTPRSRFWLLPIPNSLPISPDDGEHADIYKLRIRVRGNLEWAPPRPQIIFNIHPSPKRKVIVAKQNYRCAGCGIRTDPDFIKRWRYCEYLGKYFCQCCHDNAQSIIPSRLLRKWDFSKYYVSNFSKDLLSKIWNDPLFNIQDINTALYRKVKALEQVRLLRIQLVHLKTMFKTCRLAKDLLDLYDTEPGHLTEDLHLYSLSDLTATRKGDLVQRLKELVKPGIAHVENCVLCQAKGFICEFCGNEKDIIFPFQLNKCKRCEECKSCYHKSCFRSEQCPKCDRMQARRELLARQNMEPYASEPEEGD
ncbi:run domain Beclin-1-interacting and cysteine-rich domain-containing protein isoform X2 [Latimeria chalumnae]|uniref:run domain Beclin-1-interacting and cysteine-rich domain-containing protein isoform X2 n=1 Tax=Latimeria chalumnae TaxID=7897 RepID=UPI0003C186CE|nr:PREDICTED: run domain Beclin-1 interacting and cysteine-rich containing protein isoform X2 [Latimeria chalumnae]|eukprot:XP_006002416.1 PREDICTED: run domain Beclin-1 interacting and cysteine-rich containing protein isoform X2 [Latimeria chalumnae]